MYLISALLVSFFLGSVARDSNNDWEKKVDKNGIQVYTRDVDNSAFKEFKGDTYIHATIEEISEIIADVEKYPEWCYKTKTVKIIGKNADTIRYYYEADTPFFLKTRIAWFECSKETKRQTHEITFSLVDITPTATVPDDCIVIPIMRGYWRLKPAKDGTVLVTIQMRTEPGGIIPSWLANLVVVDSPYISLKNIREKAEKIHSNNLLKLK